MFSASYSATLKPTLLNEIRFAMSRTRALGYDALNVFNHQTPSLGDTRAGSRLYFANAPDFNMTSTTYPFGYINEKVGNRNFQVKVRFDF
jgi:hypothetical protein